LSSGCQGVFCFSSLESDSTGLDFLESLSESSLPELPEKPSPPSPELFGPELLGPLSLGPADKKIEDKFFILFPNQSEIEEITSLN
jgi:hypothetical protein